MKNSLKNFFTIAVIFTTTAVFGQVNLKTDRQTLQNSGSNKQLTAKAMHSLPAKSEQRREKRQPLFLPRNVKATGNSLLRSAQANLLLPDSIVYRQNPVFGENDDEKIVYQYNAAGKEIGRIQYEWNSAEQKWEERHRIAYDDNGNVTLREQKYLNRTWNETTQSYVDFETGEKDEYQYDITGNEILHINSLWDTATNQFVYSNKHENAFDDLKWETFDAFYHWENGAWVGAYRIDKSFIDNTSTYDNIETSYVWADGGWRISEKMEYTFAGRRDTAGLNIVPYVDFPTVPLGYETVGNRLVYSYWNYNENGNVDYGAKSEYLKDEQGNITQQKNFLLNTSTNTWEERSRHKIEYTLNPQGYVTTAAFTNWDYQNNTWRPYYDKNYSYTFDSNNNILTYQTETRREEYTYDAQNRAVTANFYIIAYDYDNNNSPYWENEAVYERGFDAYGNVNLHVRKGEWNNGVWRYEYRREYAFDAAGKRTMDAYVSTYYYGETPDINGHKYEYESDENGNEILHIDYSYDALSQTFIPGHKSESTYGNILVDLYDSIYNILTAKEYEWENDAWVLHTDYKYEWTADASNNPLLGKAFIKNDDEWTWAATMTWYYSQHEVSNNKTIPNNGLSIYPNPVKNEIFIRSAEPVKNITIYDISGQKMLNCKLFNDQPINVSQLPAGLYIVKIADYTGKFVKQ